MNREGIHSALHIFDKEDFTVIKIKCLMPVKVIGMRFVMTVTIVMI